MTSIYRAVSPVQAAFSAALVTPDFPFMIPREILKKIRQIEMIRICMPFLLLSAAIVAVGCGGTKIPNQSAVFHPNVVCENHVFGGVVVLAPENVGSEEKEFSPLWNPASGVVDEAIAKISDYLRNAHADNIWQTQDLRAIRERLPMTVCQAVGITFEGKKAILLNCLSARSSYTTKHWQQHFIKVYDGGSHYWNIIYVPETKSFTNLEVNGMV